LIWINRKHYCKGYTKDANDVSWVTLQYGEPLIFECIHERVMLAKEKI